MTLLLLLVLSIEMLLLGGVVEVTKAAPEVEDGMDPGWNDGETMAGATMPREAR